MAKKWKDIKHKKYDLDEIFLEDEAQLSDLKERVNNLEISLDIIKSLANVLIGMDIEDKDEYNMIAAMHRLCEVGHM